MLLSYEDGPIDPLAGLSVPTTNPYVGSEGSHSARLGSELQSVPPNERMVKSGGASKSTYHRADLDEDFSFASILTLLVEGTLDGEPIRVLNLIQSSKQQHSSW